MTQLFGGFSDVSLAPDVTIPFVFTVNMGNTLNITDVPFQLPRGLTHYVILDSGAGPGAGSVSFFLKGGLSRVTGDRTGQYWITRGALTNLVVDSTGPDTIIVTNATTGAQYTLVLSSVLNTAFLSQSAGAPAGDVFLTTSTFAF